MSRGARTAADARSASETRAARSFAPQAASEKKVQEEPFFEHLLVSRGL